MPTLSPHIPPRERQELEAPGMLLRHPSWSRGSQEGQRIRPQETQARSQNLEEESLYPSHHKR